jgi:hypothetical protein
VWLQVREIFGGVVGQQNKVGAEEWMMMMGCLGEADGSANMGISLP